MNRWISTPLLVIVTLAVFGAGVFYLNRTAAPQYLEMTSNITSVGLDAGKNLKSGNCDVFIGDNAGATYQNASYVIDITANDRDTLVKGLLSIDNTLMGLGKGDRLDRGCAKIYRAARSEMMKKLDSSNVPNNGPSPIPN